MPQFRQSRRASITHRLLPIAGLGKCSLLAPGLEADLLQQADVWQEGLLAVLGELPLTHRAIETLKPIFCTEGIPADENKRFLPRVRSSALLNWQ